jgi:hypothetical protein
MQPGYYYFESTLDISFNIAYYLKLRNATSIYCKSRILPTNVKLVVWTT